jgi:hypothetical protein
MYIDPNTGGMLFQILAIAFGVFSGVVLIFSSKIRMFFARIARKRRGEVEAGQVDKETGEESAVH